MVGYLVSLGRAEGKESTDEIQRKVYEKRLEKRASLAEQSAGDAPPGGAAA